MAPPQSRRQSSTRSLRSIPPPPPLRRKTERGVIKSVLLTFFFHVAALGFGVALLLLLGLTVGGLGLVLLCICSGSSRSVRVLVASLWRAELWINNLGVDKAKRENAALDAQLQSDGRSRFEDMARDPTDGGGGPVGSSSGTGSSRSSLPRSASRIGSGSAQRGREVTPSVMMLSLMYFLLFKWIFNIIFSSIPLIFWSIAIGQFTPLNNQLDVDWNLAQSSSGARYFVGIAIGFLAHQIAVTASVGSVFVSEKMAGFLFEEAMREEEGTYAPLLHWNVGQSELPSHMYQYNTALNTQSVFDPRPPYAASQSVSALYQGPFNNGPDDQQLRMSRNVSEFNRRTAPGSTMSLPEGDPARLGGPPRPPVAPVPPYPPFPPVPLAMPFGVRPNNNNLESAYRDQVEERTVDCRLFKVHIKRVHDNENSGGRGGGGRGGGGRGGGGRGGGGRGSVPHGRGRGRDGVQERGRGGIRLETQEYDNEYSIRLDNGDTSDHAPMDGCPLAEPQASARGRVFGSNARSDFGDKFAHRKQPERHELKRTKSFDSLYVTTVGEEEDLELPPHMRMYEVLDLSPSAPPLHHGSFSSRRDRSSRLDAEFPLAQLAPDQIPPYAMGRRGFDPFYPPPASARLPMRKSNSDEGRYSDRMMSMGQVQRGSAQQQNQRDQMWHHTTQMQQQTRQQREQAQRQQDQADRQRQQALWQRQQQTGRSALSKEDQAQRTQSIPGITTSAQSTLSPTSTYMREREVYARERDFHHDGITQAALEGIEKAKIEEEKLAASGILSRTSSAGSYIGSRTRARPVSNGSSIAQDVSSFVTDTQFVPRSADQRRISFTGPYQTGASDVSDYEIRDRFGSLPQTFEEDSYLDAFRLPGQSSSETITALSDMPLYRGPSYNTFSPPVSPTSTSNGSFLLGATGYDIYSPTNSATQDDDDFPSDQLPQVYRSIRYNPPARVLSTSRFAEFDDVPGRRDKVHFNAFAPPSVAPSPKPFHYTVWAFLLNQRDEMREKAEAFDPVGRKLTVDTKVDIRRGALVHVTLETPEGFRIVNGGATQGFPWEGKVCNATFDVQCTDGAAFGRVLFKATIIVGTEVAVMRSYVTVSSMYLDPADLEAQMLDSKLEVLEKTFQEIPYKSLEMKELVGKGYFGDAYRASYNGQDVVVKTIRASEFGETNDQILQEFQHEAAVLNMFGHHPCVVPFVGASTDIRYPLSVVTKYLPYGSLEDNLRQPNADEKFTTKQKTAMLKDAAAGLLNIHEGGFIHRDIAARNCLVDDNLRVKICDFGLCRRVSAVGGSLMKDTVGPVKYMAPESLQPPHLFSYDSDAYMFGVLMWETYTMSSPFAAMTPVEAMLKVMNGERLAVPENLPESLRSLMETCFHETPAQRPSMFEILSTLESTVNASSNKAATAAIAAASASLSSATQLRQDGSIWV